MTLLKFSGNVSPEKIYSENEYKITCLIVDAISENYRDLTKDHLKVIQIEINDYTHTIYISREKYIPALRTAITLFEKCEDYEKCKECLEIVQVLSKKNNRVNGIRGNKPKDKSENSRIS